MITCNADETFECRKPRCYGLDCFMTQRPPKGSPAVPPCEYECYCADGFVKTDGKCVPICTMPNYIYKYCANPCSEPSCANPSGSGPCTYDCARGCFCKEGFLMDDQENCVEKCPVIVSEYSVL